MAHSCLISPPQWLIDMRKCPTISPDVEFYVRPTKKNNNKLVGSYLRYAYNHILLGKTSRFYKTWGCISSMHSLIACHIPIRRSRVQIEFDQISPSALRTICNLGARLHFPLRRTQCNQPAINIILVSYLVINNVTCFRDGPLEKLWGAGEFSSRRNCFWLSNPLYEFFLGHSMNIF